MNRMFLKMKKTNAVTLTASPHFGNESYFVVTKRHFPRH